METTTTDLWASLLCRIITQLESLKKEAAEVERKVEETDTVMEEVERVSQQYLPLSTACSSMYFTIESLNQARPALDWCHHYLFHFLCAQVHFLYQYSLLFFLNIFESVISRGNPNLRGVSDHMKRLSIINTDMFQVGYKPHPLTTPTHLLWKLNCWQCYIVILLMKAEKKMQYMYILYEYIYLFCSLFARLCTTGFLVGCFTMTDWSWLCCCAEYDSRDCLSKFLLISLLIEFVSMATVRSCMKMSLSISWEAKSH